jgi:hypothetical protein
MDDLQFRAASKRVWAEHDKAANGNTSQSACSAWDSWTHKALEIELTDRLLYVFGQTDGTMRFPNSNEGDLLKLTWAMLRKQNAKLSCE